MFWSKGRAVRSSTSRISCRRSRQFSRMFEALEDRRLLTNYNVTTTADVVNPVDGKLSLREAIDLVNAAPCLRIPERGSLRSQT